MMHKTANARRYAIREIIKITSISGSDSSFHAMQSHISLILVANEYDYRHAIREIIKITLISGSDNIICGACQALPAVPLFLRHLIFRQPPISPSTEHS